MINQAVHPPGPVTNQPKVNGQRHTTLPTGLSLIHYYLSQMSTQHSSEMLVINIFVFSLVVVLWLRSICKSFDISPIKR